MSATLPRPGSQAVENRADELAQSESRADEFAPSDDRADPPARAKIQPDADEETEAVAPRGPLAELFGSRGQLLVILGAAFMIGALIFIVTSGPIHVTSGVQGASDTQSGGALAASPNSAPSKGMVMGPDGHGSFTPAMVAAATHGTVYVQLGDYWVAPAVSQVRAGKVTFMARNTGMAPHELMIERAPIKMMGPGRPDEMATQGMIEYMTSGHSGHTTLRLSPGNYLLFCNVPGHYSYGQHIPFTVVKS